VLAPTREIALQVADALGALGAGLPAPGLAVGAFIGGLPTDEDVRRLRRCAAGGAARVVAPANTPGCCAAAAGPPSGVALALPLLMARMRDGVQCRCKARSRAHACGWPAQAQAAAGRRAGMPGSCAPRQSTRPPWHANVLGGDDRRSQGLKPWAADKPAPQHAPRTSQTVH